MLVSISKQTIFAIAVTGGCNKTINIMKEKIYFDNIHCILFILFYFDALLY